MRRYATNDVTWFWFDEAPAPKICPSQFRLVTAEVAGCHDSTLMMFGGQRLDACIPHLYGWQITKDGVTCHVPEEWVTEEVLHDFPNNGTRKSWCRVCGITGHFHFESGQFRPQ